LETYEARTFHMEEEHMTPESIAKLATEAKVKSVVLTHLAPGLSRSSRRLRARNRATS
jgi:ribonuclease BN (tRNA processing enzyme)